MMGDRRLWSDVAHPEVACQEIRGGTEAGASSFRAENHNANETMQQPGLHARHRNKDGEISRKLGNTLIRTRRKLYGRHFADGCDDNDTLSEVLHTLDEHSLSQLVHDHERGHIDGKIQEQA